MVLRPVIMIGIFACLLSLSFGCAAASREPASQHPTHGRIAYLGNEGGVWQVWVTGLAGRESRQVTHSSYEKARVSWYPDGKRLMVHAISGELFVVDVESGSETRIEGLVLNGQDGTLSPGGSLLASSVSLTETIDTNEIVLVDPNSLERRVLPSVAGTQLQPAWSRDGAWVFFVVPTPSRKENNIWRASRDGHDVRQLTAGRAYHLDVAGSASGTIAYSSNRSGDYEVWSWDYVSGGAPVQLTRSPGFDGEPAWGDDSDELVFSSTRGGVSNLWRLDLETLVATQLTHHAGGGRSASWWTQSNGR